MQVIDQAKGESWHLFRGDCCEVLQGLPDESIDYSVFSPPFASLYVYSDSERDMGNCETDEEFFTHYRFLSDQLYRLIKPGRLVSVHCMNLPSTIQNNGYIGIRDFRGDIIRTMQASGFVYHSEVCIWKDPVLAMQRTKALGLLHKQITKDSCRSRQGIPDYVCTFRKSGENENPVSGRFERFIGDQSTFDNKGDLSIDVWQRYASPVWMDINQSRTLNGRMAREEADDRHICPLQLDVIERCLELWTNEGDVVLSPFAGIGSEGVVSVQTGRRFIGVELKQSYFEWASKFLADEEAKLNQPSLF
jgi:DNA modification methylase